MFTSMCVKRISSSLKRWAGEQYNLYRVDAIFVS